jgi:hypothetical protein
MLESLFEMKRHLTSDIGYLPEQVCDEEEAQQHKSRVIESETEEQVSPVNVHLWLQLCPASAAANAKSATMG